jgi:hypothetical protein
MLVRSDRLELLASPAFIAALALLVLNDFLLKPVFHNALTGKLSDFTGLFALTLFTATLWPKHRRLAALAIAVAFTFWKTSHVAPLIEWLNAISPFPLGRTVDLTDLVALPMIPLAVCIAPRLTPWPLPRKLQLALVVVALVAFTATSRARSYARSTIDVTAAVAVDEIRLQAFIEALAVERGLRCQVCAPLAEGRVYVPQGHSDVRALFVKLDSRKTLSFTATGYDRERGVRVLVRRIRAEIAENFFGVEVIDFTADGFFDVMVDTTALVVRAPSQTREADERAERALSSIVEDVARAYGLTAAERPVLYHSGDGFEPEYSSLVVTPVFEADGMLLVKVARRDSRVETVQGAMMKDLETRLANAFGSENVTRHTHASMPVEWMY